MLDYEYLIEKRINGIRFYAITRSENGLKGRKNTASIQDLATKIGKSFQETTKILEAFNGHLYSAPGSNHLKVIFDTEEDVQNALVAIKLMIKH